METFKALWAEEAAEGKVELSVKEFSREDLPEGDVLIKVHYSSVNYKDGLAATNSKSGVIRQYPLILGIDLSGEVVETKTNQFQRGDRVLVTGYGLGVTHHGGFSEYARVPAEWVVPLPEGLSLREAMILGTAGFTAAESIQVLLENGLDAAKGPVLVRGATGGVGGTAVRILKKLDFAVEAESRKKASDSPYLHSLGADNLLAPEEAQLPEKRPLARQRWQAAVDPVGGEQLADYLAQIQYGGAAALCGNAGGIKFSATVLPFILRGISLLGIDSVSCPMEKRLALWEKLAGEWKPKDLEEMVEEEIPLEELSQFFPKIMAGEMEGRILVQIGTEK